MGMRQSAEMWSRCSAAVVAAATVAVVSVAARRAASVDVVANLQVRLGLLQHCRFPDVVFFVTYPVFRLFSSQSSSCNFLQVAVLQSCMVYKNVRHFFEFK